LPNYDYGVNEVPLIVPKSIVFGILKCQL